MSETLEKEFNRLKRAILEKEYAHLNEQQRKAVFAPDGPLLILAGAGSGKTTVVVNRIGYLIQYGSAYHCDNAPENLTEDTIAWLRDYLDHPDPSRKESVRRLISHMPVPSFRIMAITFTNKAAQELKDRLYSKLGESALDVWASTFHSACVRILRQEIELAGYSRNFAIYDTTDSRRLVKECIAGLGLDQKVYNPKGILRLISSFKNSGAGPEDLQNEYRDNPRMKNIASVFAAYNRELKRANALDFDDIIGVTVKILEENPQTRNYWMHRFSHIFVDEYQDTNTLQYKLVSLLREKAGNLCVVGDDDQSIYRFRGATIENILRFEEQYPGATVVKLECNYRSTQTILDAANHVIRNNAGRKDKTLWTENGKGDPILLFHAYDENHEADFIASTIQKMREEYGCNYSSFAVLYRTNAQSRAIEAAMRVYRIPAKVIGNLGFYDRKEIKDVLSYLCLLVNDHDNLRLKRIINEPRRGIGDVTVAAVEKLSNELNIGMLEVCRRADEFSELSRARDKLRAFAAVIDELRGFAAENPMHMLIDAVLDKTGYDAALKLEDDSYQERLENIQELNTAIVRYLEMEDEPTLFGFLERISLVSDADNYEQESDTVSLMTLHTAKGLEFDYVFLPGMEEGLFPSSMSVDEPGGLEEERRLCYVGITRAKKRLTLLDTRMRTIFGTAIRPVVSRFVGEIPEDLLEERGAPKRQESSGGVQPSGAPMFSLDKAAKEISNRVQTPQGVVYTVGETISHRVFGQGRILSVTPMGNDSLLEIQFGDVKKKIMANFANLKKIPS